MSKGQDRVRIFSALEVANICGVVNQTAINWIKNQHLKAFITPGGHYRVYGDDLCTFLEERGMRLPDELTALAGAPENLKLLIIDDAREFNNLLRDYLQRRFAHSEIIQAFDGFEAGKLLTQTKPHLVILDIGLPGIDGFRLCRTIKSDPAFDRVRIISVSGLDNPGDEERILAEGADCFLTKPLDFAVLAEEIEKHCAPILQPK
jgi:CheY-like chemotaxis protein